MICGDSIDVKPGEMLSCSFSEDNQLDRYDISSFTKITGNFGKQPLQWEIIPDEDYDEEDEDAELKTTYLYCGRFSSSGDYVLTGGAYSNEARILTINGKLVYRVSGLTKAVQCCDWNGNDSQFAISGGDGYVRLFDVNNLPAIDYNS